MRMARGHQVGLDRGNCCDVKVADLASLLDRMP